MTYNGLIARHQIKPWLGILPGMDWLGQHEHDLDDYQPHFETSGPGFRHSMSIKSGNESIISEVMKINKRGRK